MKTVELKTKRLTIRTFLPGDEIQAHEYAGDTSITMMYWLPNKTFEETAEYFNRVIYERKNGLTDNLNFVIIYENKIIGSIDLNFEEDKTTAYMGWVLKKDYRGFGFATEAALALRDYAFSKCGVQTLLADCDARNLASANVMKKIGMQLIDANGTRTYPKTGEIAAEHMYELKKLAEPSLKIADYFELAPEQQNQILTQMEVRQDLWGAIPFIIKCLKTDGQPKTSATEGGFHELLGPGRFFLLLDEANSTQLSVNNQTKMCPRLVSFVALARNDEVDIFQNGRENWTPWISCVFTYPEYRGNSYAEKLIYHAEKFAVSEFNAEYTYISTDHVGLYEKYGYEFFTNCQTVWGEETRVLRKKMNFTFRKLEKSELPEAIELILRVFDEFEAPEYSQEGVQTFHNLMTDQKFLNEIVCYGAFYSTSKLAGIIATRNNGNHVTLFFVDKIFHRKGIGRKLFELVKADNKTGTITVNSSPYAVEVYKHLGFTPTAPEKVEDGIRFTSMKFLIS